MTSLSTEAAAAAKDEPSGAGRVGSASDTCLPLVYPLGSKQRYCLCQCRLLVRLL